MRVIPSGFIISFSAEITGATHCGRAQHIRGCKDHNCLGGLLGKEGEKMWGGFKPWHPWLQRVYHYLRHVNLIFCRMLILPLMLLIRAELTWLFSGRPTLLQLEEMDLRLNFSLGSSFSCVSFAWFSLQHGRLIATVTKSFPHLCPAHSIHFSASPPSAFPLL